jgi:phosphopantothenoylcysteine decarboxylase/phosphopantothenate--cysteine ligase
MGMCLAEECYLLGAEVTLIAGPLQVPKLMDGIRLISVQSAAEMEEACLENQTDADLIFMSAAVADYRPATKSPEKIKKAESATSILIEKTNDILAALGAAKKSNQIIVGFALETENEEVNALKKMHIKNTDFMVMNSLKNHGAGFGLETNQVSLFSATGEKRIVPLQSKEAVAKEILEFVTTNW